MFSKIKFSLALAGIVAFSMLPLSAMSHAQVFEAAKIGGGAASSAMLARSVGEIIQEAKSAANELLANAESSGNVLLLRGADELNLSIENATRLFEDQKTKALKDLDEEKRQIMLGLAQIVVTANDLADRAYTLKDTTALDTRSILGNLPFVKERLVLQRIDGLSQLSHDGDYKLRVIGSYVGLPGDGHATALSLTVGNKTIGGLRVDPKEIHVAELSIPNSALEGLFKDREIAFVPATLNIEQQFTEPLWGFLWDVTEIKDYSAQINLALYPAFAGTLSVKARHKISGWKDIEGDHREMTHSDHCRRKCGGHHGTVHAVGYSETGTRSPQLIGDRRIVGAGCSQISGPGGFDVHEGTSVSPNHAQATCRVRFRTQPTTWRLSVNRQIFDWISEQEDEQDAEFYFGELLEIRVPIETTIIRIEGALTTGEKVDFLSGETNAENPVKIIRREDNKDDTSLFVRISRPEGT